MIDMAENEDVLPALMEAWEREKTLYVREDYLKAVSALDYREYLPRLKERIHELSEMMEDSLEHPAQENHTQENAPLETEENSVPADSEEGDSGEQKETGSAENPLWDNNRHLLAELSRLRRMTERYEKHERHHFIKMNPAPELLLRTNVLHADVTAGQITCGAVHAMRGSVHVKGGDLNEILKIRTWERKKWSITVTAVSRSLKSSMMHCLIFRPTWIGRIPAAFSNSRENSFAMASMMRMTISGSSPELLSMLLKEH